MPIKPPADERLFHLVKSRFQWTERRRSGSQRQRCLAWSIWRELKLEQGYARLSRDQLGKRLKGLLDRSLLIGAVLIVEVDAVCADPCETVLAAIEDAAPQQPRPVGLIRRPGGEFRGDDHLIPPNA
jgi:hypothetical protein